MADCCPTCGHKIKNIAFWVDLQNNIVIVSDRARKTSPQVAELVWSLRKAYPHGLAMEQLMQKIWGSTGDTASEVTLRVLAASARKVLVALGGKWTISSNYASGYRLVRQ